MARKTQNKTQNIQEVIEDLESQFDEVAGRIERLSACLSSGEKFAKKVGEEQYNLLVDQYEAMVTYRNILSVRICLLKRTKGGK